MGNCQAIDAAALVIQHPNGKVEKLYGALNTSEVMKLNPGHYVALLISTTLCPPSSTNKANNDDNKLANSYSANEKKKVVLASTNSSVRITRIKLLRPTDVLVLGQVYRLITTQEVMKGLWAKKQAKGKRSVQFETLTAEAASRRSERASELDKDKDNHQVMTRTDRHHHQSRTPPSSSGSSGNNQAAVTARPRTWQPSLHSISESAS